MDKDTLISKITELGTITDDVERRSKLTELSDELVKVIDNVDTLNAQISSLNEDIKVKDETLIKVRDENRSLFLRVEQQKSAGQITEENTGVKEEVEPVKRKFEDLFKEGDGK